MIVLDASTLIGHFNPHDEHHARATQLLAGTLDQSLTAHPLTLAEVLVGAVKVGREAEMVRDLAKLGVSEASPAEGEYLELARLRVTTGLKMPDCCVLMAAMRNTAALATFDNALAAAASACGIEVLGSGAASDRS